MSTWTRIIQRVIIVQKLRSVRVFVKFFTIFIDYTGGGAGQGGGRAVTRTIWKGQLEKTSDEKSVNQFNHRPHKGRRKLYVNFIIRCDKKADIGLSFYFVQTINISVQSLPTAVPFAVHRTRQARLIIVFKGVKVVRLRRDYFFCTQKTAD